MKVTAPAPAMGAEVTNVDLSAAHDYGLIAELRAVWLEYQMIVIRGQDITPAQQLAFASAIGSEQADGFTFMQNKAYIIYSKLLLVLFA